MSVDLAVFCDGACKGNGYSGAKGGWAWAAWVAGKVAGTPVSTGSNRLQMGPGGEAPTNQRAELCALLEALRWLVASKLPGATIYTDSMYAINCTSKWGPAWRRKGWKRDSGEPLQNLDLIQPLVALWSSRWILQHVAGHQKGDGWQAYGNNWVDRAAVAAVEGSTVVSTTDIMLAASVASAPFTPTVVAPAVATATAARTNAKPTSLYKSNDIRSWFGGGQ